MFFRKNPFNNKKLIKKYGNWVEVQSAFYNFLFSKAIEEHIKNSNNQYSKEIQLKIESIMKTIERMFPTFNLAWEDFKNDSF